MWNSTIFFFAFQAFFFFFFLTETVPESAKAQSSQEIALKLKTSRKLNGHTACNIQGIMSWFCFLGFSVDDFYYTQPQIHFSVHRILTSLEDNNNIRHIRTCSPTKQEVSCSPQYAYCWEVTAKENHYNGLPCKAYRGNIYKYLVRSATEREIFFTSIKLFQGKIFHIKKFPVLRVITLTRKDGSKIL